MVASASINGALRSVVDDAGLCTSPVVPGAAALELLLMVVLSLVCARQGATPHWHPRQRPRVEDRTAGTKVAGRLGPKSPVVRSTG
jgi:hypothetical protein